ncbi:putative protein kinase RLK-Pelle-DLSV family [Helianthus annuus]|nr:putative protein kinase RLK-Pelle-DLSV family [Helianthus annuus]
MVWSSNSTVSVWNNNPMMVVAVQLLDSGNLVVWNKNKMIWQSFDYPGDTHLPGTKVGKDLVTGLQRSMTSWKSPDDPSVGVYSDILDTNGYPQSVRLKGEILLGRLGPSNGLGFSGFPIEKENQIYSIEFVMNEKEIYTTYEVKSSVVQRMVLTWDGKALVLQWIERIKDWIVYATADIDTCDRFSLCGPYGICSINKHPPCSCMDGFEPINPKEWEASVGVKVPDTRRAWYNVSMTLGECEMTCKGNCSCTAYTRKWFGQDEKDASLQMEQLDDLQCLSLHEVVRATNNFSVSNKIGEGGFGTVYKGVWEDGREIAVKRLLETSQQGLDEFKNEVICIAKLQHRNLVKLLGYCVHQNELILIYEYMTNKSLDWFLFDETRSLMLDWSQRFNIIHGIARGVLYLHQDSRLQIIHRDLKAGNILLDGDMNPKISDFGLARIFVGHDTTAKTKKVVGTYGYISPEYAVHGRFSIKSDVFNFGVLVLEIICGKKNKEFSHGDHNDNLLGHAWRLFKEGRSIELMSGSLQASHVIFEVLRYIHVALLCVQHHVEDRPTMLSVVLMLVSEGPLPDPKQPAFFNEEGFRELEPLASVDEATLKMLYAR